MSPSLAGYELKAILHSWKSFTARQMQREHGRFGGSGRTSLSTGSFAMMGSLPRSLITLSEIPGSAGLSSETTPGSGR